MILFTIQKKLSTGMVPFDPLCICAMIYIGYFVCYTSLYSPDIAHHRELHTYYWIFSPNTCEWASKMFTSDNLKRFLSCRREPIERDSLKIFGYDAFQQGSVLLHLKPKIGAQIPQQCSNPLSGFFFLKEAPWICCASPWLEQQLHWFPDNHGFSSLKENLLDVTF